MMPWVKLMKKTTFATLLAVILYLLVAVSGATAAIISSDTTTIYQTGQTYSKDFSVADTYTNVTLNLYAKGDYGVFTTEWIKFYVDGILLADWSFSTPDITVVTNRRYYDYSMSGTIALGDSFFNNSISSDRLLQVSWVNGPNVNPYNQSYLGGQDYVSWALQGDVAPVPEPATLLLFGTGLIGIVAGVRRGRKK